MSWPILKHYGGTHLRRIAMPLGGIGTGTVSLGGRGDLRDWELMSRPGKGFVPTTTGGSHRVGPFFALRAQSTSKGTAPVARVLEGAIPPEDFEGATGSPVMNAGLPRFADATFDAAYPLGQVTLSDPQVPVRARLEAFNPLIPGDTDRSGLPVAVLRYVLLNEGDDDLRVTVCGNVPNFIGIDGWQHNRAWDGAPLPGGASANRNHWRSDEQLHGMFMDSAGVESGRDTWGTLALALMPTMDAAGAPVEMELSHRTQWANRPWGDSLLEFWDDLVRDGRLDEPAQAAAQEAAQGAAQDAGQDGPMASLAATLDLPAGEARAVTFLLTWHFPNRFPWHLTDPPAPMLRNAYAQRFEDAWALAQWMGPRLAELERDTLAFVRSFCESDLPEPIKESALFNVSTLRSQTCFRTADGRFFGWEGCHDQLGSCHGSCTHVWNYEQATAFLFPELARTMREVEFAHATDDRGLMSFRVDLPLEKAQGHAHAAADGQMGCVMKLYRDWQLSGDDAMLRALWPQARAALAFAWVPGGWDGDQDGVMEGCQHNTMDVSYYGPNPQMGAWYLGALRAAAAMADHLEDTAFADRCRALADAGGRWMDEHLFNGEWYQHQIRPPRETGEPAPGLRLPGEEVDADNPPYQLGTGCLIDQLVGQYMAHVAGLGYLLDRAHVRQTLRSIMRYNFQPSMQGHFNCMRTYALGDEAAVTMASYPRGDRPGRPFPYFTEVMTGFEHTLAAHMLFEQMHEPALRVIRAIRERYDGRRRNPFDEAECGHHYARAMASWAHVLAWTGFHYSAVSGAMRFAAATEPMRWFWSIGDAWGTFEQRPADEGIEVTLRIVRGRVSIQRLALTDVERREQAALVSERSRSLSAGETWTGTAMPSAAIASATPENARSL